MNIRDNKVAFVLAPKDFRDEEYFQPKVILQSRGIKINTIVKNDQEEVTGMNGGKAHIDAKFEDLTPENYNAIIFVGGRGVVKYFDNKEIHKKVLSFIKADKIVAAICAAPTILAKAGILRGVKITAFEDQLEEIKKSGAIIIDQDIVTDKKIITARDAKSGIAFGEAIVKALIN